MERKNILLRVAALRRVGFSRALVAMLAIASTLACDVERRKSDAELGLNELGVNSPSPEGCFGLRASCPLREPSDC